MRTDRDTQEYPALPPTVESEFLDECLRYSPGSSVLALDVYRLYQDERGRRSTVSGRAFWFRAESAGVISLMGDVRKVRRRRSDGLVARLDVGPYVEQYVITNVAYSPEYLSRLRGVPLPA